MTDSTANPVSATLDADQYVYTSHAHLELLLLAHKSGHRWQIDRALEAAQRHLDNHKAAS